jgi:bacterial/archaeal transporter family-2 protein
MNKTMVFAPLAILNGSLIAIMILFNTLLGSAVGLTFSILVIQSAGLLLTLLLSLLRSYPKGAPAPAYLRIGGALGVPIVLLNTICFLNIGASLTLACGVLGQASASLGADLTGFLGVRRYAFEKQKLIGFLISLVGVAVMAVGGSFSPLYILLAFSAGIITIIQMIINSQLAVRIGLFRSTRSNFAGGLIASAALCLAAGVSLSESVRLLPGVPLPYILGGGWLGVVIVFTINWILPRIPTVYSSLLMFSGQIITAIIIDALRYGSFPRDQLIGAICILAGMLYNVNVDRIEEQKRSAVS